MRVLFSYNFTVQDVADDDFSALFGHRRRDATFAFAYEKQGSIYALRDHLGVAPLYYRKAPNGIRFSASLSDLVEPGDSLHMEGLLPYLKFGTPRLMPLVDTIEIVPPGSVVKIDPVSLERDVVFTYQLEPERIPVRTSLSQLTDEFERLFVQAIQRLLRQDTVGLYLSGGIDSALIGIYLRKAGIRVNAYTSAPWGAASTEIPYAETNARVIQTAAHFIDYLETDAYQPLIHELPRVFGIPHGTTTALGVTSLWKNLPISEEAQIFYGQNCDTLMCCVPAQYLSYFMQALPRTVRRRAHPALRHRMLISNYLSLVRGFSGDVTQFHTLQLPQGATTIQEQILVGMFVAHTPSDGEVLSQPAIDRGILVANPYYDMDMIEFSMGIPLRHRVTLSRESKVWLALEKRIVQSLALRYLPKPLVFRKKGFAVSFERDQQTRRLAQTLPHTIMGQSLGDIQERFAAEILTKWLEMTGLSRGSP